jgi:hypothetical protein
MAAVDASVMLPDAEHIFELVRHDRWEALRQMHPVEAAILLIIGVAFLLYGFRIYKILVIVTYAVVGVFLGAMAASALNFHPVIGMVGGAIILGLLAWPLYLVGWGLLGGAVLATLAAMITQHFTESPVYQGIAAAAAGALGIVLTILLMRALVIFVTSIIGAATLVWGTLRIILLLPALGDPVMEALQSNPWLQVGILVVPAILGMILQAGDKHGDVTGKAKPEGKEKKPAEVKK